MKKLCLVIMLITVCVIGRIVHATDKSQLKTGRIGAGYGVAYGFLGANGEIFLGEYIGLSAGVGIEPTKDNLFGWLVGGKLHFTESDKPFNPRLSVFYGVLGTTTKYERESYYSYKYSEEGENGFGMGWGFYFSFKNQLSIDSDIFLVSY